jgi:Domain of unknown function (DUF4271)
VIDSLLLLEIGVGSLLKPNYEVYFWVLMGINLVLIAAAKTINQGYFSLLFRTAIINRNLLQNTKEDLKLNSTSSILLTLTYFLNISLISAYYLENNYSQLALILIGIFIGSAILKWTIMRFLKFVSEAKFGIHEHGMNHLIYYQIGGIILTPILFFSHFLKDSIHQYVIIGCLVFAAGLLLLREFESIARALNARISPIYIIFYLCTLELMPLVLILYLFVSNSNGLN